MRDQIIVHVDMLKKTYGSLIAVNNVSFDVRRGEIFGMVGPNGAGKTTTIECIESLRKPDTGILRVLDLDPHSQAAKLRPRIGVQLQQSTLPTRMKVWEAVDLFSAIYPKTVDWEMVLKRMGLEESRNQTFAKLSGGQKQRLFIALALVNDPELVFLDELTTGLDPQARRSMWNLVQEIRDRGKTIFLTTHFMDEAEQLCDRIAIMDAGKIVALDTPRGLIDSIGIERRLIFSVEGSCGAETFDRVNTVTRVEVDGNRFTIYGEGDQMIADVVNLLVKDRIKFKDLQTRQPNLEDVFMTLTGRQMRD